MTVKSLTPSLVVPMIQKEKPMISIAKKDLIAKRVKERVPGSDLESYSKSENSRQKISSGILAKSFRQKSADKEKPKNLSSEAQLESPLPPVKDGKRIRRSISWYKNSFKTESTDVIENLYESNPEIDRLIDESMKLRGETSYAPISHERQRKAKEALKSEK